ncbi:MAG: hypothetical protein Q8L14_35715 [Myxococcales bacterium]|nr:hypothetical protein [Myxococcales bacterium]
MESSLDTWCERQPRPNIAKQVPVALASPFVQEDPSSDKAVLQVEFVSILMQADCAVRDPACWFCR